MRYLPNLLFFSILVFGVVKVKAPPPSLQKLLGVAEAVEVSSCHHTAEKLVSAFIPYLSDFSWDAWIDENGDKHIPFQPKWLDDDNTEQIFFVAAGVSGQHDGKATVATSHYFIVFKYSCVGNEKGCCTIMQSYCNHDAGWYNFGAYLDKVPMAEGKVKEAWITDSPQSDGTHVPDQAASMPMKCVDMKNAFTEFLSYKSTDFSNADKVGAFINQYFLKAPSQSSTWSQGFTDAIPALVWIPLPPKPKETSFAQIFRNRIGKLQTSKLKSRPSFK